ncbi:MAG: class D sortase [Firmicutes bacterium]|nr:class D sortase [Bacillota bacterium]
MAKKILARRFGLFFIIAGLALLAIPLWQWAQSYAFQRRALAELDNPVMEPVETGENGKPPQNPAPENPDQESLPPYLGLLEIDKLKVRVAVVHGVSKEDLKKGPGFYPQSSHPEHGNVSIASHRGSHGSYFLHLDKLVPGDEIRLTLGDTTYRYEVYDNFITDSRDWSVIASNGKPEITLTTCIITDLSVRLIVKGELVEIIRNRPPQEQDTT